MWSQCGDVTGRLACRLALVLLPARGGLLLGVLGAEAGPGDLDEVRTVSQPVERRRGEEWLAEELGPLRAVPVAGERDGPLFVSLVDHEKGSSGPGERSVRSEEHTSELQSQSNLVCRLLLEKKKIKKKITNTN